MLKFSALSLFPRESSLGRLFDSSSSGIFDLFSIYQNFTLSFMLESLFSLLPFLMVFRGDVDEVPCFDSSKSPNFYSSLLSSLGDSDEELTRDERSEASSFCLFAKLISWPVLIGDATFRSSTLE